jgi:hypothetical protein
MRVIETKMQEGLQKGDEDYTTRKKKWEEKREEKREHPPTYTHCDKLLRLGMELLNSKIPLDPKKWKDTRWWNEWTIGCTTRKGAKLIDFACALASDFTANYTPGKMYELNKRVYYKKIKFKEPLLKKKWIEQSIWRSAHYRLLENLAKSIKYGHKYKGANFDDGYTVRSLLDQII